jgi:chloride channel 2
MFHDIGTNLALKKTMYSAAVAAGMTCTFGAPFGALLFSIEVSSTYYMVSNLFKSFFCACFSLIIFRITDKISWLHMFFPTKFPMAIKIDHELFLFAFLGILAGLLSAVFVQIMTNIVFARHRLKIPVISDRVKWCLCIALVSGLMKFPVPFLMISDYKILNHMFTENDLEKLSDSYYGYLWSNPLTTFNLLIYVILKFILIILAVSSPIPAGLITPSFILGAVFGRLYGHIIRNIGIMIGYELVKYEGIYAIVGSAAMASGVTRTLSIAMIIFEIIGQTTHMIPILIGVLLSYAVSSSMSLSAFDALIEIKNLPFLPTMTGYSTYHLTAKDLMSRNFLYLTKQNSKMADIAVIITKVAHSLYTVPVVESDTKKILLFTVQSQQLRKILIRKFVKVQKKLDPVVQTLLKQYFEALNRFRLGEEMPEAATQEVGVGMRDETEELEPFIAFVHHKEFQIA